MSRHSDQLIEKKKGHRLKNLNANIRRKCSKDFGGTALSKHFKLLDKGSEPIPLTTGQCFVVP